MVTVQFVEQTKLLSGEDNVCVVGELELSTAM